MTDNISVFLICRNTIVREGLGRILSRDHFTVNEFFSGGALLRSLPTVSVDKNSLVLIDNGTDDCDADMFQSLRQALPEARLVVLADRFDLGGMLDAFRQGAWSYIVKEVSCETLVATLHLVAVGEKVLPSQLANELHAFQHMTGQTSAVKAGDAASLSEREREILGWLIMGCPNKVISRRMDISEATVKVHVKTVLRKLGVHNRTQAAIWAANHGLRGHGFDEQALQPAIPLDAVPHPAQIPADMVRQIPVVA